MYSFIHIYICIYIYTIYTCTLYNGFCGWLQNPAKDYRWKTSHVFVSVSTIFLVVHFFEALYVHRSPIIWGPDKQSSAK